MCDLESGDSMYDIPMNEVSPAFAECWQAAGRHLQQQGQGSINWLRAHLQPPMLEHLSFRLGNQLFFVRLEEVDGNLDVPASRAGLLSIAEGCAGQACLMPMRKGSNGWLPALPRWGLQDAITEELVDPPSLITDKKIEMTDWELQDFAVQIVRQQLEKSGCELMSWQSNPAVDPSIWFVGNDGPEWVIVRFVRYPENQASAPKNWRSVAENCSKLSKRGNFASVGFACMETISAGGQLYRGYPVVPKYDGLAPIHKAGNPN